LICQRFQNNRRIVKAAPDFPPPESLHPIAPKTGRVILPIDQSNIAPQPDSMGR